MLKAASVHGRLSAQAASFQSLDFRCSIRYTVWFVLTHSTHPNDTASHPSARCQWVQVQGMSVWQRVQVQCGRMGIIFPSCRSVHRPATSSTCVELSFSAIEPSSAGMQSGS